MDCFFEIAMVSPLSVAVSPVYHCAVAVVADLPADHCVAVVAALLVDHSVAVVAPLPVDHCVAVVAPLLVDHCAAAVAALPVDHCVAALLVAAFLSSPPLSMGLVPVLQRHYFAHAVCTSQVDRFLDSEQAWCFL